MISHHRSTSHYRLIAPLRQGGFGCARSRHHEWPSYVEVFPGFQHVGHRGDLIKRLSVVAGVMTCIQVGFGPGKPVVDQPNTFRHALEQGRMELARLHDALVDEVYAIGGTHVDEMTIGEGCRLALYTLGQKGRRIATLTGLLLTDTDAKREHVVADLPFARPDGYVLKHDGDELCHATL